ncbi:hypothetical protein TWF970_009079 [Orbilia oligospora]|uniref:Mid2 domain-containing protein n=1 Tax=Orbilia oligospora TaxID=2813651 RepID=A0A7C8V3P5_ORBOL|nr:hypothetical protein TWF970_009079 [Orbilia oligospora]
MSRYILISISTFILSLLSLHLATAATLVQRQRPTPTYTTDTFIKPTANARYQVGVPISVSWYIAQTKINENLAQSFNITIALDGDIGLSLSQAVAYPGWGEHDTTFTARDTWPESNKYQIFIIMDYGMKTLKSPNFGIWGGGRTASSTTSFATSTSRPSTTTTSESELSTTSSDSETTTSTSTSSSETSDPSPTESPDPAPSNGISGTVLGGAIGGSIAGTLAIVGIIWFMRRSMAQSRASHGSDRPNASNPKNQPPGFQPDSSNANQQWPYQQMNAPSTTSVNHLNNEYKGFAHPPPPPPPPPTTHMPRPNATTMNEMPTQMHQEPVELHSMPQNNTAIEMPGDMSWSTQLPAPVAQGQQQQQQPQRYVYGPQSYNR